MSALGKNAKCPTQSAMSVMAPTADVNQRDRQGRARLAHADGVMIKEQDSGRAERAPPPS
jgi:hypothetical protein